MNIGQLSQLLNPKLSNQSEKPKVKKEVFLDESKSSAYKLCISNYGMEYMKKNPELKIALINSDVESYNEDITLNMKEKV